MSDAVFTPTSLLITGGAGFIGSNVVKYFVQKYPQVKIVCLDKLDYCATTNNIKEVLGANNFTFVKGDIASADLVNYILASHKIDSILHFAAQTHVDNSFGNSLTFTQSNVFGTHVLLESAKSFKNQIKRFVHVSTDEVYGESTIHPDDKSFDEKTAMNPSNPYAATKAAAELLVRSYRQSFGMPVIITRGNNVYGPGQYPEKLIPKFINLLQRGLPCTIHGDGKHRRSFIYVEDVARAFDTILHKGELGEVYNIGTEFEVANVDVARHLLQLFGLANEEEKYITFVEDRCFNDVRYHISSEKLQQLGWSAKTDFRVGLQATIDWYRSHPLHWENVNQALVPHPRAGIAPSAAVFQ